MFKSFLSSLAFIPLCLVLLLSACDSGDKEEARNVKNSGDVATGPTETATKPIGPHISTAERPKNKLQPDDGQPEQDAVTRETVREQPKGTQPAPVLKDGLRGENLGPQLNNAEHMDKERADRMLAFRNNAVGIFTAGYYALPEILRHNTDIYKMTWQLPPGPRIRGKKRDAKALEPDSGLFNRQEESLLAQAFLDMDKALQNMLGHYRALEKYVKDDSIRDDGKDGRQLAKRLEAEHGVFLKARHTWLNVVEARAKEAEAALLAGHPLERQIGAAQKMLAQVREVADIIKSGSADKNLIAPICQDIGVLLKDGARPPFPAAPAIERVYREFLKTVAAYAKVLQNALDEGFYAPQKRELVDAMNRCLIAYNEFARAANLQLLTRQERKLGPK